MIGRFINEIKRIPGWRTNERLVVLAVDDYGNVRLDSRQAREALRSAGLDLSNRFDQYDAMETREDLERLYDVLNSVTDSRDRPAVFTPYALCANPDFDAMRASPDRYQFEPLPATFERLASDQPSAYRDAWQTWQDGIEGGLLKPQFHGREHINLEFLDRKLAARDKAVMLNLENRSLAALGDEPSMPMVGFAQAFALWDRAETERHKEVIGAGLDLFAEVFGFRSLTFTPPGQQLHPDLYAFVEQQGVQAIDKPARCMRRLHQDTVRREINFLGKQRGQEHVSVVRNVRFEPTRYPDQDVAGGALEQVAAAFRWRHPAIISSHRVNYCGHIDPENRSLGLAALRRLLHGIVQRWPDVIFVGADELVERIQQSA